VFHWVELRTFCHATEERERVEHALRFASGGGEIQASPTEGQHGNPILILVTRLEDRKAIAAFWDRATSKEHALAWRKNLEDRVDQPAPQRLAVAICRATTGPAPVER